MTDEAVLAARLCALHEDISDLKTNVAKVAEAVERLARLEERHANTAAALDRAFSAIARLDARIAAIEHDQPVQSLATGWVMNGVWAGVGLLAAVIARKLGVM